MSNFYLLLNLYEALIGIELRKTQNKNISKTLLNPNRYLSPKHKQSLVWQIHSKNLNVNT